MALRINDDSGALVAITPYAFKYVLNVIYIVEQVRDDDVVEILRIDIKVVGIAHMKG
ncbi:hypothetical protein DPPLL_35000 [Desulfofustis limnaeus]|uniref:Uncharacterized protein n=1 Tax=Desulfofustis limnaeus TaxID=2740163 RepID=A0ABN6M8M9_9BACT|nr:hypothetical protein DPPLL_35000 [Desulfofustis limnaeus]